MSLPGLDGITIPEQSKTQVRLNAQSEWRFELPAKSQRAITLISGTAELFGTELAKGQEYILQGPRAAAIYTWHGAQLEHYKPETADKSVVEDYVSEESTMIQYANLHFALQERRQPGSRGPRVMVVGPRDCGKSSLCKILCAYSNKMGSVTMLVNTDSSEPVACIPGAVSAMTVSDILDIEQGWGQPGISGPVMLHTKKPLVYWFGLESHTTNPRYFGHVVDQLGAAVKERLSGDSRVNSAGIIVDTPPELGVDGISRLVKAFDIDVLVVVVGTERLFIDLSKRYRDTSTTIVKVAKSAGCVDREPALRRAVTALLINEYFYGSPKQPLSPYTVTVDYSSLTIYRVAEEKEPTVTKINNSFLPVGTSPEEDEGTMDGPDMLVKLEPSSIVQNCVMAMLNANPNAPIGELVDCEVLGFVHVVEADDNRKTMRVRMPVHGQLPKRPFVIGDFRYHE